jgi:hypothetical protein
MGVLLEAQCIVDDFEGDYSPYMMYGRALLCHRKGNTDEAVSALEEAREEFPHVADQLEDPERVEPGEYEQKGGGVVLGG